MPVLVFTAKCALFMIGLHIGTVFSIYLSMTRYMFRVGLFIRVFENSQRSRSESPTPLVTQPLVVVHGVCQDTSPFVV